MKEISTIIDILHYRALNQADKTAYIFLLDGESKEIRLTYGELDRQSRHIAAHLISIGLTGERVLLLYPSGLEFIPSLLGCMYAGVVAVPAYPPHRHRSMTRLKAIMADAHPKAALTTGTILANMKRRLAESPELSVIPWIVTDGIDNDNDRAFARHETLVDGNTLALLQYTSGSTGTPKGVMVSHGNLLHNQNMLKMAFQSTEKTIGAGWLPLFHDMGLIGNVLHPLYLGVTCILMSPISFLQKPLRWLQTISRYSVTASGGPNFAYDLCVRKITPEQRMTLDLSSWEVAFNGAEPVHAETLERFANAFEPCGFRREAFYPCYGMAEATLFISGGTKTDPPAIQYVEKAELSKNRVVEANRDQGDVQAIVECGQVWLDQKIVIVDPESSNQCPSDRVGEIWVSGPSVAQGYWNRPEETKGTFRTNITDTGEGRFLRTGDLGFLKDGKLFVTGRLKDLIIIRGRNYFPQDIELTVEQSHPALLPGCGAAFSIEIESEERLIIVHEVKRTHIRKLDVEDVVGAIRRAVTEQHELQVYAVQLLKTASIPKTLNGKIQRNACRFGFLNKSLNVLGEWQSSPEDNRSLNAFKENVSALHFPSFPKTHTVEVIQAWMVVRMARRLKISAQNIDIREPFSNYGMDSKELAGLTGELEEWLGRRFSSTLLFDYPTIEILARYLVEELGSDYHILQSNSSQRTETEPVAIIGMGCRFPCANEPEAFWQLLHDGVDAITEFPSERKQFWSFYDPDPDAPGKTYSRFGGFLEDVDKFDPQFFGISPREAVSLDPQQRLLLEVSWEALEHANIAPDSLFGSQTGVFIGIGSFDYSAIMMRVLDPERTDAYFGTGGSLSVAAGRISYTLGLTGPSMVIDTACSSSLVAIHQACQSLRNRESDLAIAGGVNCLLNPATMVVLSKARMLSADGRCKAFDAAADGYVRSEGCGIIILKRMSDALVDGDSILALIRGSAVNQDGPSGALTVPNGPSQEEVIRQALVSGGIEPSEVCYIEAHGTGTSLGDPIELEALGKVFGIDQSRNEPLLIGSAKTNVGHGESASGIIGLIKVVLSLQHEEIPPHLHFNQPNPQIPWEEILMKVPTEAVPWPSGAKRRIAGVSSFGFSGTNAHAVLEEAPVLDLIHAQEERPLHLLTLSAKTDDALLQLAERYEDHLAKNPSLRLGNICFTANTSRSHFTNRLSVVAESSKEVCKKLSDFRNGQKPIGLSKGQGFSTNRPKIAFLFTGQGSQYLNMGRQLFKTQPSFRRSLKRCDEILRPYLEKPLLRVMYPETDESSLLDETAYTQPALFALEYALAELWRAWGVEPDIVMGHSVGEYVAACVAGVFSLEDGLKLIAARARLMQKLPQDGEMVAVLFDEWRTAEAIQPYSQKVSIAAINGPQSIVISGERQAVHNISTALEEQGIKTKPLQVSHAFHSPLMEPMMEDFKKVAAAVTYASPQIDIISNVTGNLASLDIADVDYWCNHVRQPVRFADGMGTLNQLGYRLFVEVGPRPTLLGMGRQCMPGEEGVWLPSLRNGQSDWLQILQSLGELYVRGVAINWSGFDRDFSRGRVVLPTYPFQRQRYWFEVGEHVDKQFSSSRREGATRSIHPLLGQRIHSAALQNRETQFESKISSTSPDFLDHHRLFNTVIVPAAVYSEMALAAGAEAFKKDNLVLEEVTISRALILPDDEIKTVQLILTPQGTSESSFQIFSLNTNEEVNERSWELHASGKILVGKENVKVPQVDLHSLKSEITNEVSVEKHFQNCQKDGVDYGPCFHTSERLWVGEGEALSRIRMPEPVVRDIKHYKLHPALLDASFQVFSRVIPSDYKKDLYLPLSYDRLHIYRQPGTHLWCHAKMRPAKISKQPRTLTADLCLLDDNGDMVAQVEGHTVSRVDREILLADARRYTQNWLYEVEWQLQENQSAEMNLRVVDNKSESWLIFSDSHGVGKKLATILREKGYDCTLVFPGKEYEQVSDQEFRIDPIKREDFQRMMAVVRNDETPLHRVVHLWSFDGVKLETLTKNDLEAASKRGCGSVLHLMQSLVMAEFPVPPFLCLVTRGAVQVSGDTNAPGLPQSSMWGMGRVIALEHPEFHCTLLDLDPSGDTNEIQGLFKELRSPDQENQIAFRQGIRYVPRITKSILQNQGVQNQLQIPENEPFQLSISNHGTLDGLFVKPMMRRQPGPGEVEIQVCASGLNFRDLLTALGMLQEYTETGIEPSVDLPLGFECSGKIVDVGNNVSGLMVGDEVMAALAMGSLGSFVTVNAKFVVPKPENLSFEEAATIPIAFTAAHYGLERLAKLGPEDRVLIHAASGGVGQAAVQLAQRAGAEVFATASPSKWGFLRSLGVEHIMNSRTLDFADEIKAITKDQGVDIVLNSLNGEYIPKSLEVLGKGGRFVEIGKIGIWDEHKVHQLRPDISYFPFDLGEIASNYPDVIETMLNELEQGLREDTLKPLPHKVFTIQDTISAFRYMQQAKHIGKIVISQPKGMTAPALKEPITLQKDSTYLITGGLGALGLQVAHWMAEHGAEHLVLVGRKGVQDAISNQLREIEQAGTEVLVAKADVSDAEQVARILKDIEQSLPPLRGIIHAAGIIDDGILLQLSWDRFSRVMTPKVEGAWNLHTLALDKPLDFFVLFSSTASLLGSPGQGNYAAANAFMDALAHYRHTVGLPGLSINWGPWSDAGMAADLSNRDKRRMGSTGIEMIAPDSGLYMLGELLKEDAAQIAVQPVNWKVFLNNLQTGAIPPILSDLAHHIGKSEQLPAKEFELLRQLDEASPSSRENLLMGYIQDKVSKILWLGDSHLDIEQPLNEAGIDSLMAVELRLSIKIGLEVELPMEKFLDGSSIADLAALLNEQITEGPSPTSSLLDKGEMIEGTL